SSSIFGPATCFRSFAGHSTSAHVDWKSAGAGSMRTVQRGADKVLVVQGGDMAGLEVTKANPAGTGPQWDPDATTTCSTLDYAGADDWRLPQGDELILLAAAGIRDAFENVFGDVGAPTYSGESSPWKPRFWSVNFSDQDVSGVHWYLQFACFERGVDSAFCQ